jgi:hypothetical protein
MGVGFGTCRGEFTMNTMFLLLAFMAPPITGEAQDQKIKIEAQIWLDRAEMKQAIGFDPGPGFMVVKVKVTPGKGEVIDLNRDDFLLRSDKDGEKSRPFEPTQIAGSSVMVISSRGGSQGEVMSQQRRVPMGLPVPTGGDPRGVPGQGLPMPNESPTVGGATADTSEAQASFEDKKGDKALLEQLRKKQLPDGELKEPVEGLLYFQIEGKHKVKHFELVYRKAPPRVHLRFVEPKKK